MAQQPSFFLLIIDLKDKKKCAKIKSFMVHFHHTFKNKSELKW